MKRTASILMALGLMVGFARAESVASQNTVGYYTLPLQAAGGLKMMAINLEDVGGWPLTLLDIFGSDQLIKGVILPQIDRVIVWDKSIQKYQTYAQRPDGLFYLANDGTEWSAQIESNPELDPGSAIWLDFRSTAEVREIAVVGQAVNTIQESIQIVAGLTMLGFPYSTEVAIDDINFENATKNNIPTLTDRIVIFDTVTGTYKEYGIRPDDSKWYTLENWASRVPANITFELGDGFWYDARNPFMFTETRPYNLDLIY